MTAVVMILTTVQSLRRSWLKIVWYFAARPCCNRNPKMMAVIRPSRSWSADSNMVSTVLPIDQGRRRDSHNEGKRHEDPTRHCELQCAADAVPTRAASGQARAEDHQCTAEVRKSETLRGAVAEAPAPQRR